MVQTQQNTMSKRSQILEAVAGNPRFAQAVEQIEQRLAQTTVTPELLDEIVKGLEFVLENPDQYPQLRAQAIQSGLMDEQDAPAEFDPVFVVTMLAALYGLQERRPQSAVQEFSHGGLGRSASQLQSMGRAGDTILAHINPKEAEILRRMGGGGTINPNTGLVEFKSKIGKIIGVVASIAMPWIAPAVGSAIAGSTLGASLGLSGLGTAGTAALGGAAVGMGSAALQGQNPLKGALLGGVSGGIAGGMGNALGSAILPAGTNAALSGAVGAGLAGGLAGAATGQGFGKGALSGLVTHGLSGQLSAKPSDAAVSSLRTPYNDGAVGAGDFNTAPVAGGLKAPATAGSDGFFSAGSLLKMAPLAAMALSSANTPEQVRAGLSPDQQEYFDRTVNVWDWDRIKADATAAGKPLGSFVAENWDKVNAGNYNKPSATPPAPAQPAEAVAAAPVQQSAPQQLARGGALSQVAYLAKGSGTGRSDEIPARLSDGEFVIDAETVALLGDGSTEAGATRLDEMRKRIRQHKGKALAKGKFSANAKSPLNYIKEVA